MAHRHRRVAARPARLASRRGKREAIARPLIRAALAAAILVLLSACGGDGSEDTLSAEEFREQANALCADFNERIADLGSPSSPEEIPEYIEQGIPVIEEGIAELRALNPPEELQEDYDAMLDATAQAIPAARRLSEAAADQDADAVEEAISQGQEAEAESNRLARELGLDTCASEE